MVTASTAAMQLGLILLAGLVVIPAAATTGTTANDIQSTPFFKIP